MHKAQSYFDSIVIPASFAPPLTTIALNAHQATNLQLQLYEDARDYLYSAAVSVGDAVQAIQLELYSWATVKLYYSLFYALRSILATSQRAIIYHTNGSKSTPYLLECNPGKSPVKLSGNTHKVVIQQFSNAFPSSFLLSQEIELKKPFTWIMEKREEANYKNARFYEPLRPPFFKGVVSSSMRQTISTYVDDTTGTYAFDPDHAILALPIKVLSFAEKSLVSVSPLLKFSDDDLAFLCGLFRDRHGIIKSAKRIFS